MNQQIGIGGGMSEEMKHIKTKKNRVENDARKSDDDDVVNDENVVGLSNDSPFYLYLYCSNLMR